ncbi:hypothetical protein PsYK624_080240 [Phanerochaete sordida]|uniref:Uncharacterized protein n=1 Tax=Phanerochaete sordida TaxID=48140 RepID=A0A9P3LET9_9APHY|nr:hypothetical protein PsYK624_080240 [Phanerochaete sordida]
MWRKLEHAVEVASRVIPMVRSVVVHPELEWGEDPFMFEVADVLLQRLPRCIGLRVQHCNWAASAYQREPPPSWARLEVLVLSMVDIRTSTADIARLARSCTALRTLVLDRVQWRESHIAVQDSVVHGPSKLQTFHVHPVRGYQLGPISDILDMAHDVLKALHVTVSLDFELSDNRERLRRFLRAIRRCQALDRLSYMVSVAGSHIPTIIEELRTFYDVCKSIPPSCKQLDLHTDMRNVLWRPSDPVVIKEVRWDDIDGILSAAPKLTFVRVGQFRTTQLSIPRSWGDAGKYHVRQHLRRFTERGGDLDVFIDATWTASHSPRNVGFWVETRDDFFVV